LRLAGLSILLLFFFSGCLYCKYDSSDNDRQFKKLNNLFEVFVSSIWADQSQNFFEAYNDSTLRGKSTSTGLSKKFNYTYLFSFVLKFPFRENLRWCLTGEFFRASVEDGFLETYQSYDGIAYRSVSEYLSVSSIPLIFSIEYIPYKRQFANYVGFGLGLSVGKVKWAEGVSSTSVYSLRNSCIYYDKVIAVPCTRLYSGVELAFDDKNNQNVIYGLNIEAKLTYFLRYLNMFEKVKEKYKKYPSEWDNSYAIVPFYLGLSVGVSFNLDRGL
jgi:hypothetical protein